MKLRMHRGSFSESMSTECEIEPTRQGVIDMLRKQIMYDLGDEPNVTFQMYVDGPDKRNGWAKTVTVLLNGSPTAFIDGSLEGAEVKV